MTTPQVPGSQGKASFLDLPGELRNQIYHLVLPDQIDSYSPLRKDGTKASTNFMATCRQVYEEAVDILYADGEFDLSVTSSGDVRFVNSKIDFSNINKTSFSGLNRVKVLNLRISANEGITICNVQDALFAVLGHLRPNHKLHALNVVISVETRRDDQWTMFSSNYAERMYSVDVMREFRDIKPGDLSRAHLTAFLTDPLRTIRGLRNGNRQGKFTLNFTGKGGRPWREIKGEVFALIKGTSSVPDYKIFSRYYDALRTLIAFAAEHDLGDPRKYRILPKMAGARIQGDVSEFRKHHESLLASFGNAVREKIEGMSAVSYQEAEQKEQQARELVYLVDDLCSKLPAADADTSFFGYNLADDALLDWQRTGRAEEKEAKEKRKREKEAQGGSRKKTKL